MNRDQYTAKQALMRPDSLAVAIGASAALVAANAERWRVVDIEEYRRLASRQGGAAQPPEGLRAE